MIHTFNYHNVCGERDNPWIEREGEEETISFFVFDWTMVQIKLQGISLLFFGPLTSLGRLPKSSDWLFLSPTTKPAKARYCNGKALGYIYDRHPICPTQVSFHYSWVHTANLLGQRTIGTRRLWAPKDL